MMTLNKDEGILLNSGLTNSSSIHPLTYSCKLCVQHSVLRIQRLIRHTLALRHLQAIGGAEAQDEETMQGKQVFQGILVNHTLSYETSDTDVIEVNTLHQELKSLAASMGHQGIMRSHPHTNKPDSIPRRPPKGKRPRNLKTRRTDDAWTLGKRRLSRL